MFKKKNKRTILFLLISSTILLTIPSMNIEANVPVETSNLYKNLHTFFASQLGNDEKIINDANPNSAVNLAELTCTYCDLCEQREAVSPKPLRQDISIDTLEKLGIINRGSSCTVANKLSTSENTIFANVERIALFMGLPSFDELKQTQEITRYFAEHADTRRDAFKAIEKIRMAQNEYLQLFSTNKELADPLETYYWKLSGLKTLNHSTIGLAAGDAYEQLFCTLGHLIPPCAYWGAVAGAGVGLWNVAFTNLHDQPIKNLFANVASIPYLTASGFFKGLWGEIISHWPRTYSYAAEYGYSDASKENPINITLRNVGTFPYTSLGDRQKHLLANLCTSNPAAEANTAFTIANLPGISQFNTYSDDKKTIIRRGVETLPLSSWRGPKLAWTLAFIGLGWRDLFNGINMRSTYQKVEKELEAFKLVQARLMSIARLFEGLKELKKIATNSDVAALKSLAINIANFENMCKTNKNLAALNEVLKSNTFKGKPSVLSNRARILHANRLVKLCKKLLVPALGSAGKIEVYATAAEFYAKHQGQNSPVCFIDFVNDPEPRLELEHCWNILVDESHVVYSNIKFGKNGSQHAIFSGPNGTGKSTHENAIAHMLFTEKLGIACAAHATMTPFELLAVHRNEQENIETGYSSFMAQKAHFDAICKEISTITNKRMFIIMDEPLNGTVEEEAGRIIYEQCKNLIAPQKQVICLIATHAQHPTELEAATNGAFVNYFVKVEELSERVFKRTFELEHGIPHWWFNDAEKRHRFVEWLSNELPAINAKKVD